MSIAANIERALGLLDASAEITEDAEVLAVARGIAVGRIAHMAGRQSLHGVQPTRADLDLANAITPPRDSVERVLWEWLRQSPSIAQIPYVAQHIRSALAPVVAPAGTTPRMG